MSHSICQVVKHVIDGNSQTADAGLATALSWLDRNDSGVVHILLTVLEKTRSRKWNRSTLPAVQRVATIRLFKPSSKV